MRIASMIASSLMTLVLVLTAVQGTQTGDSAKDKKDKEGTVKKGHGHGPHGGIVFDLGKYHAEFTADHAKKEVAIDFLKTVKGKKEKEWPPEPVEAKELTLVTKETKTKEGKVVPAMTIKLLPKDVVDGKASKFVGSDPGVGNAVDFEGTVIGEIAGKPSTGKFKE